MFALSTINPTLQEFFVARFLTARKVAGLVKLWTSRKSGQKRSSAVNPSSVRVGTPSSAMTWLITAGGTATAQPTTTRSAKRDMMHADTVFKVVKGTVQQMAVRKKKRYWLAKYWDPEKKGN